MKPSGEGWWRARQPLGSRSRPSSDSGKMGMIFLGRAGRAGWEGTTGRRRLRRCRPPLFSFLLRDPGRSPAVPAVRSGVVTAPRETPRPAAAPARFVSLIPATTELLFAIGADSLVVGRTNYC